MGEVGFVKVLKMELAPPVCLNMFLDKGSYCPSGDQEKVPRRRYYSIVVDVYKSP